MFGFKNSRRKRLRKRPFPWNWLTMIKLNVPYYNRLPPDDQIELQGHIQVFLAEKTFEGCGGLTITDEIKLTIAAQACILLLHRQTDYYPGLSSILVYPEAYVAPHSRHLESGVIVESNEVRLGESWHRGSIVLSWEDVRHKAKDIRHQQNVVLHEFAHQIDISAGRGDATPVLLDRASFIEWARTLQNGYEKLCADVGAGRPTVLSEYGATDPAEFFAVATESFFENPLQLKKHHPELYNELKKFYQQDPAALL
jgi:Mlc titration factor MtfA (ptsG expression regulator)